MKQKHLIIGGVALVALLLFSNTAAASSGGGLEDEGMDANVRAFLKMLQWCEGTFSQPNPYAVCYGYDHVIQDFSDHPAITGEWMGKVLPAQYCYNVGLPAGCKSTAAGAYQFLKNTWKGLRDAHGLDDFGPANQSYACIEALDDLGALSLIRQGKLKEAINKASGYWASLPGNQAGQPQRTYAQCEQFYKNQGGSLFGAAQPSVSGALQRRGINLRSYAQL